MIAKGQKGQNSWFSSEVWLLQEGLGLLDLAGLAAERFEQYSGHSGWNAIRPVFFRFCDLRTTITTSFSNIRIIHRNASFFKYNPTVKKGITQVISTKFCDGNIFWLQYFADRGSTSHLRCEPTWASAASQINSHRSLFLRSFLSLVDCFLGLSTVVDCAQAFFAGSSWIPAYSFVGGTQCLGMPSSPSLWEVLDFLHGVHKSTHHLPHTYNCCVPCWCMSLVVS